MQHLYPHMWGIYNYHTWVTTKEDNYKKIQLHPETPPDIELVWSYSLIQSVLAKIEKLPPRGHL